MPQWSKLLFTNLILSNLWWSAGAPSVFTCWMSMELSVVLLMPLLVCGSFFLKEVLVLKYFIIQSVSGLLILSLLFMGFTQDLSTTTSFSLMLIFMLKTGTFPFFQWMVSLGESVSWYPLFILLSVQKIIPLMFMIHFCSREIELVALTGWVVLPILVMNSKKMKPLIVVSSVFLFLAILCSLCSSTFKWKNLMLLYMITLAPVAALGDSPLGLKITMSGCGVSSCLLGWSAVLLSFMGMPPLPGFLMKVELFSVMLESSIILSVIFLSGSMMMIWIYLNLWFLMLMPISTMSGGSLINESTLLLTCLMFTSSLLLI